MTATATAPRTPFKGPAPLGGEDSIYGREEDLDALTNILISDRIVLLYSSSGAGKTSLLEAGFSRPVSCSSAQAREELGRVGLKARMKARGFRILPSIRVSESLPRAVAGARDANRFVYSVLSSLENTCPEGQRLDPADLASIDLSTYFGQRECLQQDTRPTLLVFDQFEEVLNCDPTDFRAKQVFFSQLGQVLGNRMYWALFAMREEYIAGLDSFLEWVPTGLSSRFRLDLLTPLGACAAIKGLAKEGNVVFEEDAARYLVKDLACVGGEIKDLEAIQDMPLIEPLHLQVVGRDIWRNLGHTRDRISRDLIETRGGLDRALEVYYAHQLQSVCTPAAEASAADRRPDQVLEGKVRNWFDSALISNGKTRDLVDGDDDQVRSFRTHFPRRDILAELGEAYLIRKEVRPRRTWYELAHDRLIGPIRKDNARWFDEHLAPVQRQAAQWEREKYHDRLLYSGEKLSQARRWIEAQPLGEVRLERRFVRRSVRRQWLRRGMVAVGVAFVVGFLFMGWQYRKLSLQEDQLRDSAMRNQVLALPTLAQQQRWRFHEPALAALLARQAYLYEKKLKESDKSFTRAIVDSALAIPPGPFSRSIPLGAAAPAVQTTDGRRRSRLAVATQPFVVAVAGKGPRPMVYTYDGTRIDKEVLALGDDRGPLEGLLFFPRGEHLAVLDAEGIGIFDRKAQSVVDLPGSLEVAALLGLSPDGRYLVAAGNDGQINLWHKDQGQWIRRDLVFPPTTDQAREEKPGYIAAFSGDSSRLAVGTRSGRVAVWVVGQWDEPVWTPQGQVFNPCPGCAVARELLGLGFGPNGKRLITIPTATTDLRVWDVDDSSRDNSRTLQIGQSSKNAAARRAKQGWGVMRDESRLRLTSVAFTPTAYGFATGDENGAVRVWDLRKVWECGQAIVEYEDWRSPLGPVRQLAFSRVPGASPAEVLVAADSSKSLRVFDYEVSDPEACNSGGSVGGSSWSGGGQGRPSAGSATPGERRGGTGPRGRLDGTRTAQYDPERKWVYSISNRGVLLRRRMNTSQASETEAPEVYLQGCAAFDLAADEEWLVAGRGREVVRLRPGDTDLPLELIGSHDAPVSAVVYSPKGNMAVSGDARGGIKRWDLTAETRGQSDTPVWQTTIEAGGMVTALAIDRQGQWLALGTEDGRVEVRNLQDGTAAWSLPYHEGRVEDLAFDGDGKWLVSAGNDGSIYLWEVGVWTPQGPLRGHSGGVSDIAFDADGDRLASVGDDGNILLWRTNEWSSDPTLLRVRGAHGEMVAVEFNPSGDQLVYVDAQGRVGSVDARTKARADKVCEMVWRNLSRSEWDRFIPNSEEYQCTCSELGPGPGVELEQCPDS